VKFADEGWQDVRVIEIEIITGSVEVRWHGGDRIETILFSICLAHLDASNFCDRIPLIRRFQLAG
jgi:hypothetical protein